MSQTPKQQPVYALLDDAQSLQIATVGVLVAAFWVWNASANGIVGVVSSLVGAAVFGGLMLLIRRDPPLLQKLPPLEAAARVPVSPNGRARLVAAAIANVLVLAAVMTGLAVLIGGVVSVCSVLTGGLAAQIVWAARTRRLEQKAGSSIAVKVRTFSPRGSEYCWADRGVEPSRTT